MPHKRNQLLANLSDPDYAMLEPNLEPVQLTLGQVLCEADDEIRHIYFPHESVVSVINPLEDGSDVECYTMGRETAFGLLGARESWRTTMRSITQMAGGATRIRASAMREVCAQSPSLRAAVRLHLRVAMGFMGQSVACNARHKVEARLARWLLTCSDYRPSGSMQLTQEFMATMLGVRRTTVTDVAAELQDSGVISVRRGNVEILDRAKLLNRSCECYTATRGRIDAALRPPSAH